MIPIVFQHRYDMSIGHLKVEDGKLFAVFDKPITRKEFFDIFPTCGMRYSLVDIDKDIIDEIEIMEFSSSV